MAGGLTTLPAAAIIGIRDDGGVNDLLVLSQAVLAMRLASAMVPLLPFTNRAKFIGRWKNGWFLRTAGWASAGVITAFDLMACPMPPPRRRGS